MEIVKLKEVLKQYRNIHWIEDKNYRQVTISQTGDVSYRGTKHGSSIGRKRQFVIDLKKHPNTLIFIRQGVYKGGIGICPPEVDGCIVTENMPMFDIINIKPKYLMHYLKSPQFKRQVNKLVPLGTAQKAVHERQLLDIEISLPSEDNQEIIIKRLEASSQNISEIYRLNDLNETYISKLRQAILQEAVQGKLVPQDPNDEPASELLKKIHKEKENLIKEGKIKKQKTLPPISEDEIPYELPEGWEWVRLDDISLKITDGEHATPIRSDKGFYLLSARNITDKGIDLSKVDYVEEEEYKRIRKRCNPEIDDILISCSGSVGRVCLSDRDDYVMVRSAALVKQSHENIISKYLLYCIKSKIVQDQILIKLRQMAQANLFLGKIAELAIPLPPLSEQKRIVEKVDKLVVYCDELEKQVKENQANSKQLMNAVLSESFKDD